MLWLCYAKFGGLNHSIDEHEDEPLGMISLAVRGSGEGACPWYWESRGIGV